MHDRYLCRGKRMDGGAWVQGYYVPAGDIATIVQPTRMGFHAERPEGSADAWMVDTATLGQCTDLRDKNGTLVFEGDIIQFTNRRAWYRGFSFDENDYIKYPFYREAVILPQSYERLLMQETKEYWEVIGNIHDNPALLEPAP